MARKGTMTSYTIESDYLKESMQVKVYEPESYDMIYERQICIMQDGDDYFNMGRIATVSDRLHDDEELVNTVFVGIHYIDRADRWKKYYPAGEQYEAYKAFLLKEVIPLLDENLSIHPLGSSYSIMGDSLAATFALTMGLSNKNIFTKIILQSPFVDQIVLDEIKDHLPNQTVEIYHSIGLQETKVKTTIDDGIDFVIPNKQLEEILHANVRHYTYAEISNGNHTWKYWQKELPNVLIDMFS